MADVLRHLRTPTAPSPLAVDVVSAVAAGALTLVDPARLTPGGRFAFRSATAALGGLITWFALREEPRLEYETQARAAYSAAVAGFTYGAAELSEALDARLHRGLLRLGVERPRVVMALAATGLALAAAAGDRGTRSVLTRAEEAEPEQRTLNPQVRDLVAAILERTEDYDSLRLRAQLAVAAEEVWGEGDGEPIRSLELSVPDDVPLAVPHAFTFPVSARFTSPRGVPCVVQLLVEGGRLRSVLLDVSAEEWVAVGDEWMERNHAAGGDPDPLADVAGWPAPSEVTFVVEQSGRF